MKRFLISAVLLSMLGIFASCSDTTEQRIHKMIQKDVKTHLINKGSFKETNFELSELYSLDGSLDVFCASFELEELVKDARRLKDEISRSKSYRSIYSGRYTDHERVRYDEESEKIEKSERKLENKKKKISSIVGELYRIMSSPDNLRLAGFIAEEDYVASTTTGDEMPACSLLIVDSTGSKIVYKHDLDIIEIARVVSGEKLFIVQTIEYIKDLISDGEMIDVDDFIDDMESF